MTDVHPLVQGLVVELPPSDGWWTRENRDDWMSLLVTVIDFLYDVEEPKQITAASESTIDAIRDLVDHAPADVTGPELAEQIRAAAGKHRPPWEGWAPPPPDRRPLADSAPPVVVEEQAPATVAAPAKPTPPSAPAEPRRRAKTGGIPTFTITHAQVDELGTRITKRQEEICRLIASGNTTSQIAAQLDITVSAVNKATLRVRAAMNGRTPAPHVEPVRPIVTETVPCRIPGCRNDAPRRGRNAGRCKDHRGHSLPDSAPVEATIPKAERPAVAPPTPPPVSLDPYLTTAYCDYCNQNMSQRHVDQHKLDVERERARQEAGRAKVKGLSRPTGIGGAA